MDHQCEGDFSEENAQQVAARARELIGMFGFTLVSVMAGENNAPFSYTVGLTEIGEPELMILGVPEKYARVALDDLAARVVDDGQRYRPGDVPPEVLANGYEVMICGPLPAGIVKEYPPGLAGMLYGKDNVRVYQVVAQDRHHIYPWQVGYDMPSQPYLGGGRG